MKIDRLEIELEEDADLFDGAGVVPFYMKEEKEDGEGVLYIEAYSGIEDVLNEFASRFAKSPFTDKALSYLNDTISPYLEEKGYRCEKGSLRRYYHSFEASENTKIDTSLIRSDSFILSELKEKISECKVTFDIDELLERSLFAAVSVIDGKIVSIAAVNEYDEGQRMLEITTETAREYRGMGLATSNTALLTKYLLERDYLVAYCTSRYNKASIKIAEKCGFEHTGRFFAIAGYRYKCK